MVNLEGLSKYIDSTQLTSDLDGSLHYDHAQWIDIRLVSIIYKSIKRSHDGLDL